MFNKKDYSDVTVSIHGTKLYAHRFVVCVQSPFFAKAFQDKKFLEGETGEIEFHDASAMAYWRVFQYLYTGDYLDDLKVEGLEDAYLDLDDPAMLKDSTVYALADMFFIKELKALALVKLQHRFKVKWQGELFPECVREVYAITKGASSMRSAVAQVAADRGKDLQGEQTFLDLLHEGGDFVVDFYKALRLIW
ncbi:hypothetical protein GQ44DRAFT_638059 [Phaeosphaeriaceae sp. PMI808]|nr:hypothetical protein GQ44DRAFT_638059 [Phaeosphaeriaceae sp. PMI808]